MSAPLEPDGPRDVRYWLGQLGAVWRRIIVFTLVGLGLVLLLRFGPRALLILVPVGVLLFGTTIFAWVVLKLRRKG